MEYPKIHEWELAVDGSERSPLTSGLPADPVAGAVFDGDGVDGVRRRWLAVRVVSGKTGGRWVYWAGWKEPGVFPERAGLGPHPLFEGIADSIFNGDAAHFVGMLAVPYVKMPGEAAVSWVLVDPKPTGPRVVVEVEGPLPSRGERYERSNETYDVETGETREVR